MLIQLIAPLMVTSVWKELHIHIQVGLKCVLMVFGVRSAIIAGIQWMPVLYVGNLDTQDMVKILVLESNYILRFVILVLGARALGLLGCGDVRKHLSFVRCLGNERRLIDCPHTITISSQCHGCYFWGDASVICQPCNIVLLLH